jgi:RNA polymerase sigma-70 factor, ECF subfamily
VLQTIFLRLLRKQDPDAVKDQESYLRRAAVNAALDLLRSRRTDGDIALLDVPSGAPVPDSGELRTALRRALGRLSPRAAEIFALRFFEGLSNQEIGRLLGMSRVLVAVIVHRSRQQLQRDLNEYR